MKGDSMMTRVLGAFFCFLFLLSSPPFGTAAENRSTLEIPAGSAGIIAYGSLMSLPSMEQTLGRKYAGPVHHVHLEGYERAWTSLRPFDDPLAPAPGGEKIEAFFSRDNERVPLVGAVQLNVRPKRGGRINAILYLISVEELARFDKREYGYRRVDVTGRIEEFRFRGGRVYAYQGLAEYTEGRPVVRGKYVLIKEFLDSVTSACDVLGRAFRDEYENSTKPCAYEVVSYKNIIWEKVK